MYNEFKVRFTNSIYIVPYQIQVQNQISYQNDARWQIYDILICHIFAPYAVFIKLFEFKIKFDKE